MKSQREERPRKNPLFGVFLGFGFGILFLAVGLNRPSIANMRTVDLVHLLGTGACIGAGVAALAHFVARRKG